jgi:hypothetical protein
MTVCVLNGDYRKGDNGVVDIEKVKERLNKAEQLLKSVHESA